MASETTTTCDRCGEIIREARVHFRVESGRLRQIMQVVDLCKSCGEAFTKWLNAGQSAVTEEETASA